MTNAYSLSRQALYGSAADVNGLNNTFIKCDIDSAKKVLRMMMMLDLPFLKAYRCGGVANISSGRRAFWWVPVAGDDRVPIADYFVWKNGLKVFMQPSNKRTFLRCSGCARIFWNILLNWEIPGINGGQSLSSLKKWLKCSLQLSWHPLVLMTGEYFFICNVYRKWKLNVAAMTVWVVLEYNQTAWPNQETTFTFYKT